MEWHTVYKAPDHKTGHLTDWTSAPAPSFLPLESFLAPAESKPALLGRLFLRLPRLGVRLVFESARFRRMLLGVLDVVPRNVQEQWLDGNRFHLRRIADNVLQVNSFGGVLAELVDQGPLCRLGVSLVGLLPQVGNFDQRPATLQLSLQKVLKKFTV